MEELVWEDFGSDTEQKFKFIIFNYAERWGDPPAVFGNPCATILFYVSTNQMCVAGTKTYRDIMDSAALSMFFTERGEVIDVLGGMW